MKENSGRKDVLSMSAVVDALCGGSHAYVHAASRPHRCDAGLPSRAAIEAVVEDLRSVLFPRYFGSSDFSDEGLRFHVGAVLDKVTLLLQEQIKRGLCFGCDQTASPAECDNRAAEVTRQFVARLPELQRLLATDVTAAFEGDPAAHSLDETIFCYPGILAITNHRIAHELNKLGVPLIPRIINEYAHSATGIDIHPGAQIGERFFIDHGTGVVIGETTIIGRNVRLYQGVTLGAKSFPLDANGRPIKGVDRHPILEDDVVVYAGATILGRITIGKGSMIGGNVWLTHAVPEGSRINQQQTRNGAT
jgi:serine O-acetyltransferase